MKFRLYTLMTIPLLLLFAYTVSSGHAVGYLATVTDPTNFSVAENQIIIGTIPVDPGSVSNADQVTVSVTGTDASYIRILFDSISNMVGLVFFNHTPDFEMKQFYTFNARIDEVGDGDGVDSIVVNVRITDVDEAAPTTTTPIPTTTTPTTTTPIPTRRVVHRCGLGWSPYAYHLKRPKVMIYALEFEYIQDPHGRYTCSAIEIRTGDATILDLDGWKLYLGTRYNPSYIPIKIRNSQIDNGILRITPEMLGLERFTCSTAYMIGQPVPSVDYTLKNENNLTVDRAYSCYLWGQVATTQDNGIWKKSQRRISGPALREMPTPRIERYILKPNSIYITYMPIDEFQWDRAVFSDWLLPAGAESQDFGGNAPSLVYRKLTTSWAALKKNQRQ